jgi:hypothetical protein
MTDKEQLERFGEAVERKKEESERASRQGGETPHGSKVDGDEPQLTERGRPQDERDPRAKNAGKGKKTADKWNQ